MPDVARLPRWRDHSRCELSIPFALIANIRANFKTAWRFCLSPHDLDGAGDRSPKQRHTPAEYRRLSEACPGER